MKAVFRITVPLRHIVWMALCIGACSKPASEADLPESTVPPTPLVTAPASLAAHTHRTSAGGIAARYTPLFENETLVGIDEQRESDGRSAKYVFNGARLVRYEGAPLDGEGWLVAEFDMQGKLISARIDGRDATEEQLSAIRTRAQLLRSHAMAQRASRTHALE